MGNVITPLTKSELDSLFDEHSIKVIEFFLKELLMTKPEVLPGQEEVPIYAPQEYVEQWFVQALGARPIGAGSYPIDVIKDDEYGADIKSLSYKVNDKTGEVTNSQTGEASLGQKFEDEADSVLDELFKNKEYQKILDKWKSILSGKYSSVQIAHGSTLPLYFFFILRGKADFYLTAAKVDPSKVNLLDVNHERSSDKSVFIKNYIDENYGNCKIYKAKKRMELRLLPRQWIDNDQAIRFEVPKERKEANLRDLSEKSQLDEYLTKKFNIIKEEVEVEE